MVAFVALSALATWRVEFEWALPLLLTVHVGASALAARQTYATVMWVRRAMHMTGMRTRITDRVVAEAQRELLLQSRALAPGPQMLSQAVAAPYSFVTVARDKL